MTYYEILGIEENATQDQIKSAYRSLAKKYHPDVNDAQNATAFFRLIQEAYETLSDPAKKVEYDNESGSSDSSDDYYSDNPEQAELDLKKIRNHYNGWCKRKCKDRLAMLEKSLNQSVNLSQEEISYRCLEIAYLQDEIKLRPSTLSKIFSPDVDFPLIDAIVTIIVATVYFYLFRHIHIVFSLLIGAAIALILGKMFQTKIGSWIISIIFSAVWAAPFGWLTYSISHDTIWLCFISGIIFIISMVAHRNFYTWCT